MARVPFHKQTHLRNLREASRGPRDGSHAMTLPRSHPQIARNCAQPTAMFKGQI